MLIVQKYGGTSLADNALLVQAAKRIVGLAHQGHKMVVVVSAQGHQTDILLEQALSICPQPNPRELDALLSTAEQCSAALLSLAIQTLGTDPVSLNASQAGIHTDDTYTDAQITWLDASRLRRELENGKVCVVAGFQGTAPNGDITTLGRGGSDTTAVALAAGLKADMCQIYTDVDGVYSADPRKHPEAQRFDRIDYDSMLTLIDGGAQVLHRKSVEIAQRHNLLLEVRSAFTDIPGTVVGP